MDAVEIIPPDGPINATVRPPGSKSITNRALPIAAVAKGTSTLTGVLKSDDTIYMIKALKQLGVEIDDSRLSDIPEESVVKVKGCEGQFKKSEADLFLGNSGTSIRFLTAMVAAAGRGIYRLDGIERMRQRPIGPLVDALRCLGATCTYEKEEGFPPILVETAGFTRTTAAVSGSISSQFISGLIMAQAATSQSCELQTTLPIVSPSYVFMTCNACKSFGRPVDQFVADHSSVWIFKPKPSRGFEERTFDVEPDASAASYWYATSALGHSVNVRGLDAGSWQSDSKFRSIAKDAMAGGTFDFSDISDTAQTMAAVAVFADSPTTVTGVEHMRHKECDRVSAVVTELRKLGIECDEHTDGYTIYPGTPVCKEPIETYDDHRMAMSFALLGLKVPGIIIKDPDCVNKTYPRFWDDWAKVTNKPVRRFTL